MKKILLIILIIIFYSPSCQGKRDVLVNKWFKDSNTFIIVCKGYPKEGVSGTAKIETAKEAALINAQFIAQNTFNSSVDVIRNGIIDKYEIHKEYVVIYYIIKQKGLKGNLIDK